jgi:hypothetical protein
MRLALTAVLLALCGPVAAQTISPQPGIPLTGGTATGNVNVNKNVGALPAPINAGATVAQFLAADAGNTNVEVINFGGIDQIISRTYGGTNASQTALGAGQGMLQVASFGYDGVSSFSAARMLFQTYNAWTGTDHSTFITFTCIPVASITAGTCATITSNALTIPGALVAGGSPPTLTGTCTTATQVGGNTAGTFLATCAAQTVIVTFATTAPNGWACNFQDVTTVADTLKQTAKSTTSCTASGTTVASDVIVFNAVAY